MAGDDDEATWTTIDVARVLGIDEKSVYTLATSGRLPSRKIGHARRFVPAEVHAYVREAAEDAARAKAEERALHGDAIWKVHDAAACIGVTSGEIFKLIRRGDLPSRKFGRARRFVPDEVRAYALKRKLLGS